MKITIEKTETGNSMPMHWMGNSFLCSEYMKTRKRLLGLWFSDFGNDVANVNVVDPIPKEPAILPCPAWLSVVDAGVGILVLGYVGLLVLHLLDVI